MNFNSLEWAAKLLRSPLGEKPLERLLPDPQRSGHCESFDGTRIYWELHGALPSKTDKKPLLFFYGLICSMNQWRKQVEYFSKEGHPCFLFDYRGHNESSFPDDLKSFNFSALARDARNVLAANEVETPVHVWAHSMGVNVALEFCLAYPDVCSDLVLCCGNVENPFETMLNTDFLSKTVQPILNLSPHRPEFFSIAWKILLRKPEISKLVIRFAGFNRNIVDSKDVDTYLHAVSQINPLTFLYLINEMAKGATKGILSRITCPVLVIGGESDYITPLDAQKKLASLLMEGEFCSVPAGSHNLQLEFDEYICLKAKEFWTKKLSTP